MHDTAHTLAKKTRASSIVLLQSRLFDTLDAASQAKQAHWNVKGPSFLSLHELFDRASIQLHEHADAIAERIAALGGTPVGTARRVADSTSLPEYPEGLSSGRDHVTALAAALATLSGFFREAIDASDRWGDAVTADFFTSAAGELDKVVWMVEAHRQSKD